MTGPDKRISVAVAGLGVIARTVHLPLLERRADLFEVVAMCDLSPSQVEELGARCGVAAERRHTDTPTMLAQGGFDALLLLTSGSHGQLAAAALAAGVPVFCEKPLAYTRAEAARLADLDARAGSSRLMVGYMKQYDPAVAEVARLLEGIGGAAAVHSVDVSVLHPSADSQLAFAHLPPSPADLPASEVARLRDADARLLSDAVGDDLPARTLYQIMINSVSHDLSLLRLFIGAPATVDDVTTWPASAESAAATSAAPAAEPSVEVSGRLPAGGRYHIGWHYLPDYPTYRETVTLHHARGSYELVFPSPYLLNTPTTLTVVDGRDGSERRSVFRSVVSSFEQELVAFHAMVTGGSAPMTGIVGGTEDLVTSQRVVRRFSERTGAAISGEAASA